MRINIYRGQVDGTVDLNNAIKVPDTIGKMPDSGNKVPDKTEKVPDSSNGVPDTTEKMPDNEQEQQIYKYVSENAGITTAQAMKLLGIKQRRTREILVKMIENGWLRREGASRSTIYVKNTETK